MTDPALVAKKLAVIETCVRDLRTLARPQALKTDLREERFVEHTLQIAIQVALDVASHVVSDERLGEPETNRDLFALGLLGLGLPGEHGVDYGKGHPGDQRGTVCSKGVCPIRNNEPHFPVRARRSAPCSQALA